MNKHIFPLVLVMACLVMASCHRVRPQGPANQPREDSAAIALIEMHYRMAEQADRLLVDSVQQSGRNFTLSELGFWYNRLRSTDGQEVKRGDEVEYEAQIYSLEGDLIENVASTTHAGSHEVILAIDNALQTMRVGEQLEILAPYYTAYGFEGEKGVGPMVNVRVFLQVNNIR